MKKLIKISDYYYVTDTDAEIKENDWFYNKSSGNDNNIICQCTSEICSINAKHHFKSWDKIISTTNPSLPLPQITNPSDELVGKEIEVKWNYEEDTTKDYIIGKGQPAIKVAIIKLISKTPFNPCKTCKYFHTECTERQRKYNATSNNECFEPKETSTNESTCPICNKQMTWYAGAGMYSCNNKHNHKTSTNETLEEVALSFAKNYVNTNTGFIEGEGNWRARVNMCKAVFIAGYKHAESKRYS